MTAIDTNPMNRDLARFTINLKGKAYLSVAGRVLLFRDVYPNYGIETEVLKLDIDNGFALFRAVIKDESGRIVSTAHASETLRDFGDYLEKCETKSIGRALVLLGFGTDSAGYDLDEGERFADAPQPGHHPQQPTQRAADGSNYSNQRNGGPGQPNRNGGLSSSAKCSFGLCGFTLTATQASDSLLSFGRLLCVKHQREIFPVALPDDVLLSVAAIDKDARDNTRDSGGPGGML